MTCPPESTPSRFCDRTIFLACVTRAIRADSGMRQLSGASHAVYLRVGILCDALLTSTQRCPWHPPLLLQASWMSTVAAHSHRPAGPYAHEGHYGRKGVLLT